MAIFFPQLSSIKGRMQAGERRFAQRLDAALEDDYLCWFDVPVGNKRAHPDFTIFHPGRGLLVLEVKDWKADTIRGGNKHSFQILTATGQKHVPNPLEQARQYAHTIVNLLVRDPQLQQQEGAHAGKLLMPWGYGVVFTQLSRKQVQHMAMHQVIDDHLILCRDDLAADIDAEVFQTKLWNMFNYPFSSKISQPQVDRIRAHLWPEICVQSAVQEALLLEPEAGIDNMLPDVIKVMDYEQEQLARSLGEGHRVIHGVAGSGKTMILGFRCLHLAKLLHKPILVLCFNVTLAARLRGYISAQGAGHKVVVCHFHDWCAQQIRTYQVNVPAGDMPYFQRQVLAVIQGVEKGHIPRAQYGAILIDEAHDFEPEWLQLITGMVDPAVNALLLLYDDAQSIYRKHGLGFTLSSVGIQARGRTKVLKLNYRNTRQILRFAFEFAQQFMTEHEADEDEIPLIRPESGGKDGQAPAFRQFTSRLQEEAFIHRCLEKWRQEGRQWRDIAIVYRSKKTGIRLARMLEKAQIPYLLAHDKASKADFSPELNRVCLLTMHSSKGLEFATVIVAGVGETALEEDNMEMEIRLLYIAMTRAMENLLITSCMPCDLANQLQATEKSMEAVQQNVPA